MLIAVSLQHSSIQLNIAKMPGNKFYNGILFGLAEALAMIVSNLLLLYLDDMLAFKVVFSCGIISYIALVFCEPDNHLLAHLSTVLLMVSIGG